MQLKKKIKAYEGQMRSKLAEIRDSFTHTGNKGSNVENIFREFLRSYLPRNLEVSQGEIVDKHGSWSQQTDIVIASEDHPFTFTRDMPGLFFIEGVYSGGEIKTVLTSSEMEKAISNSQHFKKLRMDIDGRVSFASRSDLERYYVCPPWFLFAFESQLSLMTIQSKLEEKSKEVSEGINYILDAVFILDKGFVVNIGEGQGSYSFSCHDGTRATGWVAKESQHLLFDFLGWLSVVMPRGIRLLPILPLYLFRQNSSEKNL